MQIINKGLKPGVVLHFCQLCISVFKGNLSIELKILHGNLETAQFCPLYIRWLNILKYGVLVTVHN